MPGFGEWLGYSLAPLAPRPPKGLFSQFQGGHRRWLRVATLRAAAHAPGGLGPRSWRASVNIYRFFLGADLHRRALHGH